MAQQQMFGSSFDTDILKQAIRAEEERGLLEQAKLSSEQMQNLIQLRSGAGIARGAGNIVESLFGVQAQDPRMRQMQEAQSAYQEALGIAGSADSPDFFVALSNSAARRNLPQLAQQAAVQASTLRSEMAQEFGRRAAGIASLVKATADKRVPLADRLVELNTKKANQGLTTEEENERVALESVVKLQAPKESKTIIEGQKNILDIDKEDAKDYKTARISAEKALPTLNRMQTLLNSPEGIIQGTGTEARTGFLKALDTLGISTAAARKAVANTEQFNIEVRNLLQSIIKQFGYNPSNADVRFALESLPNASNSPEGLRAILNALIKANKDQLNESTRALEYYRKNQGSFSGFQRKPEIFSPGAGTRSLSDMTTEELESMLAARKGRR